jgi:acyl-CoA reductase-like NAD-dependent aldehyde dehydrogenase
MIKAKIRMSIPISIERQSESNERPTHIPCVDPATREPLGDVPIDSAEDVDAAVARAKIAQKEWRTTSFEERREVLRQLLAYTVDEKDEICLTVQRDSGKTRENALMGEIWPTCEKFRWMIKNGEKHLRPERVSAGVLMHKKARLEYHPLGVVAAIIPWNYPFQNIVNPLIPALMSGNAIVLKPSEWVAWSSAKFVDSLREIVRQAGHNPDLIQAVQGYGPTGAALARSAVDTILFIGSVRNGRRVVEASAERVVPVVMELGGKDAFIVCDDADLSPPSEFSCTTPSTTASRSGPQSSLTGSDRAIAVRAWSMSAQLSPPCSSTSSRKRLTARSLKAPDSWPAASGRSPTRATTSNPPSWPMSHPRWTSRRRRSSGR